MTAPASSAFAIAPSDAVDLVETARAIYAGGSGTVALVTRDGTTAAPRGGDQVRHRPRLSTVGPTAVRASPIPALHAGAGPVIRLVLAGEGSTDPAVVAEGAAAFAALAAVSHGIEHLADLCAAHGLVFLGTGA